MKRKHRNTTRLTSTERATAIAHYVNPFDEDSFLELRRMVQGAIQDHTRAALRRARRRAV